MKKSYYILIILLLCLLLYCVQSCIHATKNNNMNNINYGVNIKSVKEMGYDTLNIFQLDSVVKADTLPAFSKWTKTYLKEAETNKQYVYSLLYDYQKGIIYTIKNIPNDSTKFIMQKRKATTIKTK